MRRSELIQQMRPLLLKRRELLRKLLDDELATIAGECDEDIGDTADLALEAECREVNAQLADVESRELKQIDEALKRLTTGNYGVCAACEQNIPMARLRALPYATNCIDCQRQADLSTTVSDATGQIAKMSGADSQSSSLALSPTVMN